MELIIGIYGKHGCHLALILRDFWIIAIPNISRVDLGSIILELIIIEWQQGFRSHCSNLCGLP